MKKQFVTVIDASAEALSEMYVSGGRIGLQICANPKELANAVGAKFEFITHE